MSKLLDCILNNGIGRGQSNCMLQHGNGIVTVSLGSQNQAVIDIPKDGDEATNKGYSFPLIDSVVVHLAAASLLDGKSDCVPEAFQDARHSNSGFRKQRVVITGNKTRDAQIFLL